MKPRTLTLFAGCLVLVLGCALGFEGLQAQRARRQMETQARALAQAQAAAAARTFSEALAELIPTGVFLKTLDFLGSGHVRVTGKVWQRFRKGGPPEARGGVSFPEALEGTIDRPVVREVDGEVIQLANFSVVLKQNRVNSPDHPFDHARLRVLVRPIAIWRNEILVPDTRAYRMLLPDTLPGVDRELSVMGWKVETSFFSYLIQNDNANFGMDDYVGQQQQPELLFNLTMRREFLNPFIATFLPIVAVVGLLFAAHLTVTRNPDRAKATTYQCFNFLRNAVSLFLPCDGAVLDVIYGGPWRNGSGMMALRVSCRAPLEQAMVFFRVMIPVLGVLMNAQPVAVAQALSRPPVAKIVAHQEVRHGETVADPYAWLREKDNPEVVKYLEAENAYTQTRTRALAPFQDALYQEMLGRIKQKDLTVPVRRGHYFYYTRTEEGQQYPIHCRKAEGPGHAWAPAAPEEVLLDLNEMAKGHPFLGLGAFQVSDDDQLLLYTTDLTGYRQYELHVKDLRTGTVLADTAQRVDSVAWAKGSHTFFFATEDDVTKRANEVWRMEVGGKPERVLEEKDELFTVNVSRTKDRALLMLDFESTDTWEVRYLDAAAPAGTFKTVLPREKGHKYDVEHRDGLFYIRTNKGAKDYQLVTAPVADPAHWKVFVAPRAGVKVEGVELFQDYAVVRKQVKGLSTFRVLEFKTGLWHDLTFPEPVYSAFDRGNETFDSTVFRFNYQSMVTPPSTFDYDLATRARTLLKQEEVKGYDPKRYTTRRLWATARDGVKVPLSVVYRKGLARDGKAPLWLYAYGSYGLGMPATFNSARLSLLDRGVVYVIAHIRGGDELGERWHEDGMLMKKMNTFTDFIDSADYLVANKWTSRDRLVIEGGSAGGLLMGAVTNLRPDLCKAVHAAVPFVDVMSTMLDATLPLTVGEYLEWGNPNDKAAYDYMKAYSPYDNLAPKAYPAILVTSSFNDSQVGYWEPAKYVARLRTLKTDDHELLLKMKLEPGGHGGASGRFDRLKDVAFEYAWMLKQVGITK